MLPFDSSQFFAVFAAYNTAIWPAPVIAYGLAAGAVAAAIWPSRRRDAAATAVIRLMWFWTGIVYHAVYFATINTAALGFAALFAVQACLFFYAGIIRGGLKWGCRGRWVSGLGLGFIAYAAALYPLASAAAGHTYPATPTFGVTPCTVTIFTLGLLMLTRPPAPWFLLPIPVVWSLIGGSAAVLLNVPQDWVLLVGGPLAAGAIVVSDRSWRAGRAMS